MGLSTTLPLAVGVGMLATIVVSLINVALLIYAVRQPSTSMGTRLLYQGDCHYVATRSTVVHLIINVLGTLVLAGSNTAMQCLSSPTRENIDRAHAKGKWLDIGIGSLRNLNHVERGRRIAWVALLLTSLPLHLLYNSVLIQSTTASEYWGLLVTQDFLTGAPIQEQSVNLWVNNLNSEAEYWQYLLRAPEIQYEVQHNNSYNRLDYNECMDTYSTPFVQGRTNVVVVTNITTWESSDANSSLLTASHSVPFLQTLNYSMFYNVPGADDEFGIRRYIQDGTIQYPIVFVNQSVLADELTPHETAQVEYCLSLEVPPSCRIEFYVPFMAVVIACNIVKLVLFAIIFRQFPTLRPFFTVGDAISSFLRNPDPHTPGGWAIGRQYIELGSERIKRMMLKHGHLYLPRKIALWGGLKARRTSTVGRLQETFTYLGSLAWLVTGAILIHQTYGSSSSIATLWQNGLGNPYPGSIIESSTGLNLPTNIVIANTPQLAISILYLAYNQTMTTLCISNETSKFSISPRFLRVTSPSGKQRSTFWLGLPYRFSVPLLVTSAVLHWAVSQSVFLASISVVNPDGSIEEDQHINAVGYSVIGFIMMYIVGGLMILALFVIKFRRLTGDIPAMGSCSLAISAACHGQAAERFVDPEQELQYGMTEVTGEKAGKVGFSDQPVEPLQKGWDYNAPDHNSYLGD